MTTEVIVGNNQSTVSIPEPWLTSLESGGARAAAEIRDCHLLSEEAPLATAECVEVALVDDAASARVHDEFMGVPGETDVITFDHGELVIGIEVAQRQAAEFEEPVLRELFRYVVHGLLHLAGHEDQEPVERAAMEKVQEELVRRIWPEVGKANEAGR